MKVRTEVGYLQVTLQRLNCWTLYGLFVINEDFILHHLLYKLTRSLSLSLCQRIPLPVCACDRTGQSWFPLSLLCSAMPLYSQVVKSISSLQKPN